MIYVRYAERGGKCQGESFITDCVRRSMKLNIYQCSFLPKFSPSSSEVGSVRCSVSGSRRHKQAPSSDSTPNIISGSGENMVRVWRIYALKKVKAQPITCTAATPWPRTQVGMSSVAYWAPELQATVTPKRPITDKVTSRVVAVESTE